MMWLYMKSSLHDILYRTLLWCPIKLTIKWFQNQSKVIEVKFCKPHTANDHAKSNSEITVAENHNYQIS